MLGDSSPGAEEYACRLALMAWEKRQHIFIITSTKSSRDRLNDLMWSYPEGRFLPHARASGPESDNAPVKIGTLGNLNPADVVINLSLEAVPQPERFSRVLEIVPHAENERQSSRQKYKIYLKQGLKPETHGLGTDG